MQSRNDGYAAGLPIAAQMSGVPEAEYAQMMLDGGRSVEGNRSKKEQR